MHLVAFVFSALLLILSPIAQAQPGAWRIISAKIKNGKIVIRTIQPDCNTLSASLKALPQTQQHPPGPQRFEFGASATKKRCEPNEPTNTPVDVEVDLPEVAVGSNVQIWSGTAYFGYTSKRPQPDESLTVGSKVPAGMPAGQTPPAPGEGGGANR